jgi:hypothetical protein
MPHLQVLSSAWMPFVLFGSARHFATGRTAPLAGALAWLTQKSVVRLLSAVLHADSSSPTSVWELTDARLWTMRGR